LTRDVPSILAMKKPIAMQSRKEIQQECLTFCTSQAQQLVQALSR